MNTQVIQLECHDDVTSVKDKIAWSKASRILLVWAKRGRMFYRPLDLLLLQRICQVEGAQLACVTEDDDILDHAKELGIPVFRSTELAERLPWRQKRRKRIFDSKPLKSYSELESIKKVICTKQSDWQNLEWVRLIALLFGIAAVFCLVLFLIPEARISLVLKQDLQEMDIPVYASPDLPGLNPAGGLPVTFFNVIVEGQDSQPASGTVKIPDRAAGGKVQFTNLTDQAVTIPVGLIVETTVDPVIQFETVQDVYLPARPGTTVEGMVQAKIAGSTANVLAKAIRAVSGPMGASLAVTNLTEITGGRDLVSAAGTQQDADRLREKLTVQLKQAALVEMRLKKAIGSRMFEQTLEMAQVIEENLTPSLGFPADLINLRMRVEFRTWTVKEEDLFHISTTVMDANLPGDGMPLNSTLSIEESGTTEKIQNQISWKVHASRQVRTGWDEALLIKAVAGNRVQEGQKNIAQLLQLTSPPEITLSPSWWPVVPLLPGRIIVVAQ